MLRVARCLRVKINFTKSTGELIRTADMPVGSTLLQAAHKFNLDVEGACGGECACATCHMILPGELYRSIPGPKTDEADMIDLAADSTQYSRLGCQVKISEEMEGFSISLPASMSSHLG
jgi:ferredoxin